MTRQKSLLSNQSGNSAMEFALLAPVLAIVCLGVIDGWSLASSVLYMRSSVGSAANLYLQGAGDDASIRTLALENWQGHPEDAEVSIVRSYRCGTQIVARDDPCTGSEDPEIYVTVTASGTWTAPFPVEYIVTERELSHQQVIRVR